MMSGSQDETRRDGTTTLSGRPAAALVVAVALPLHPLHVFFSEQDTDQRLNSDWKSHKNAVSVK